MKSIRRILILVALIVPLSGCAGGQDPAEAPPEALMQATTHLYEHAPVDAGADATDSQTQLTTER